MKIVIIEDEKLTAKDLARTILAVEQKAEIVAILNSVEDSVAFFETEPEVDLIFSDIQLGDGMSFRIFELVGNKVPIIFCTAYDEYALEAFKTTGIDYLLKPFSTKSVENAISKFNMLTNRFSNANNQLSVVMDIIQKQLRSSKSQSLLIYQGDKIIPLEIESIAMCYIEDNNVYGYTFLQKKHLLNQKLEQLEKRLAPEFFRVNRQFLLNRKIVKDASHYFDRKMVVNLTLPFPEKIIVGKLKVTDFLKWLSDC